MKYRIRAAVWGTVLCLFCVLLSLEASAAEAPSHLLYCGPTEQSAVAATFSDGDSVTVLDRVNSAWARIVLEDGTVGYCDCGLLGTVQKKTVTARRVLVAKTLYPVSVRISADAESPTACRLAANVHVALLSEPEDGYYKIALQDQSTGYLPSDAVAPLSAETAVIRTTPTLSSDGARTEEEAAARLKTLSQYFEDGRYWNYIGTGLPWGEGTAFSVTDIPCAHSVNGYNFCNVYNGVLGDYFPEYGVEMQCLGYASLLSDLVFGTEAPVTVHYDFDKVRVGDTIRLVYYEHAMLVTDVGIQEDGTPYILVTEVNADYENCQITWNHLITKNELYALGDIVKYFTRYEDE